MEEEVVVARSSSWTDPMTRAPLAEVTASHTRVAQPCRRGMMSSAKALHATPFFTTNIGTKLNKANNPSSDAGRENPKDEAWTTRCQTSLKPSFKYHIAMPVQGRAVHCHRRCKPEMLSQTEYIQYRAGFWKQEPSSRPQPRIRSL